MKKKLKDKNINNDIIKKIVLHTCTRNTVKANA